MTALPRRELRSRKRFAAWSMATSPHLSLKLRDALGPEAGDELILLVDKAASDISDLRGDIAEFRHQMELRFAGIDTRFASVDTQFASVDTQFVELRRDMEKQTSRLILWSFAFWVTTLAAVMGVVLTSR